MAVSTGNFLRGIYNETSALGKKVVNSDGAIEIEGFESNWLLVKQFPWPTSTPEGEIEVPMPLGSAHFQAQQNKIRQQGAITLFETHAGHVDKMLIDLIARGGQFEFNAKIYEGTPEKFLRYKPIYDCFIRLDPVDRDWENRSQVMMFNGEIFYHYFGEVVQGNSGDYR